MLAQLTLDRDDDSPAATSYFAQIPSIASFEFSRGAPFLLTAATRVLVDSNYANTGSPSLLDFATIFRQDLLEVTGFDYLPQVSLASDGGLSGIIYLTLGASDYSLYNGQATDEGYEFDVSHQTITIKGSGARGAWWGTRTLLQQAIVSDKMSGFMTVPSGSGWDAPGWEVRGFMLDAGRHWFETSFLTDLCTYASFFKLNEFHIHASDNLWDPNWLYTDLWPELYSGFRFRPANDSANYGVVPQLNESWSQSDFQAMQSSCAAHGITIVPEIDTPGHSLAISQWKPELMLAGNPDQLNLSYPATIPTIQDLWEEFLPWFTSTEISIGADEYPSQYADEYIYFVNDMADYVYARSRKSIRVWGTYEPSNTSSISKNVTIQHWDFPGDTIPVQLLADGYKVINSEQVFLYLDGKTSDGNQFPLSLNESLFWTGAPGEVGWAPNVFSATDESNNTYPGDPGLRGAIFALWEDWGNNATDPLEVYLQLSKSITLFGEKSWAGSGVRSTQLTQEQFDSVYPALNARAPGQNLNRAVKPLGPQGEVFSLNFGGHDFSQGPVGTGVQSVGPPYVLSVTLTPLSGEGTLFRGEDTALLLQNLTFVDVPTNTYFSLPLSLPLGVQSTLEIHATCEYTYLLLQGQGREVYWTTRMDIWGERMQLGNMSFPAPSAWIGEGFEGEIGEVVLRLG
ncbi:glycoside hydrolase [Dacryopinax primogenitus]|uniref:beta-N-acetylhexosaminidase n=1 Tax=Dacryopinax primogenitus (strain DJM 731) TaxID=1858805 RepID=M5FS52_DACPD|nr:glycoside hydrolase [Dacryopinax primogenitus]EJT97964.1 glycoside hydrolase [Dacryopinax primogenitus]